jgi:glutamate 5-kinase
VTQLDYKKQILRRARRIVVKIGSQILSSSDGIEEARLRGLVHELAELHDQKKEIVVVSSGAAAAGIPTVIASGLHGGILGKIFEEEDVVGTLILAEATRLTSRKHWIAYNLKPAGEIVVDQGAHDAVVQKGKSLLPSGLKEVRGAFGVGECVRCLNSDGREFARGLVNYSAQELNQIKGLHTSRIEKMLGYKAYEEIIHRDDLVVL